jgi:hypothetical protein
MHFSLRIMLALVAAIGWCLACERAIVQQRAHERQWIVEHGGVVETSEGATDSTIIWRMLSGEGGSPEAKVPVIRRWLDDQPVWLITIPKPVATTADIARIAQMFPEASLMLQNGTLIELANPKRSLVIGVGGPWVVDFDSDEYDKP